MLAQRLHDLQVYFQIPRRPLRACAPLCVCVPTHPLSPPWAVTANLQSLPSPQGGGRVPPIPWRTAPLSPSQPTSHCFLSKVCTDHTSPPLPQKTTPPAPGNGLTEQHPALLTSHPTQKSMSTIPHQQNSIKALPGKEGRDVALTLGKLDLSLLLHRTFYLLLKKYWGSGREVVSSLVTRLCCELDERGQFGSGPLLPTGTKIHRCPSTTCSGPQPPSQAQYCSESRIRKSL